MRIILLKQRGNITISSIVLTDMNAPRSVQQAPNIYDEKFVKKFQLFSIYNNIILRNKINKTVKHIFTGYLKTISSWYSIIKAFIN